MNEWRGEGNGEAGKGTIQTFGNLVTLDLFDSLHNYVSRSWSNSNVMGAVVGIQEVPSFYEVVTFNSYSLSLVGWRYSYFRIRKDDHLALE